MLVLSRRADESIYIELDPQAATDISARDLFRQGPIEITVIASGISFARIGIQAPNGLRILRAEARAATAPSSDSNSDPSD